MRAPDCAGVQPVSGRLGPVVGGARRGHGCLRPLGGARFPGGAHPQKSIVAATSNVDLSVQPNEDQAPRLHTLLPLRRNMGSQRTMPNGTKRTSKPSSLHIAALRDPAATRTIKRLHPRELFALGAVS